MSVALLKKSLELCESDYINLSDDKNSKSSVKIIKKKKGAKDIRGAADVKKRNLNSIEQVKKRIQKQKIREEEYLNTLKRLKKPVIEQDLYRKILDYTRKPGAPDKQIEIKEPESAFTEEEFLAFEREYYDDE